MQISLKAARINAGLTQREAAVKAKIPVSTLFRWENGDAKIPAKPFLELCRIYKVGTDDIFLP